MRIRKIWSNEEVDYLRENWKTQSQQLLIEKLHVSYKAIYHKAWLLKLGKKDSGNIIKKWSVEENKFLLDNWEFGNRDIIQKYLERSWKAIVHRAIIINAPKRKALGNKSLIFISAIDGEKIWVHIERGYMVRTENRIRLPVHRTEMEKLLGRKLEVNERVHHKNGVKSDNSPDNLMLYDTQKIHYHIDTERAEIAEKFIKNKNLWNEYQNIYKLTRGF